jgi:hypothetical protein
MDRDSRMERTLHHRPQRQFPLYHRNPTEHITELQYGHWMHQEIHRLREEVPENLRPEESL